MIKFGPSGNSEAFHAAGLTKSTESATFVKEMGLDLFEYSFGRGVNLSDEKAMEIGAAFKDAGVEISVHAPYYINFANPEEENAVKSALFVDFVNCKLCTVINSLAVYRSTACERTGYTDFNGIIGELRCRKLLAAAGHKAHC